MHFPETSIENLRGFGYTEDEARFVYLVATHSGYFSARQYLAFTGAKSGEKSMALTQKVLGKGHAAASKRSCLPPLLPLAVSSHRSGKSPQSPRAFGRTHPHKVDGSGFRPGASRLPLSRNRA